MIKSPTIRLLLGLLITLAAVLGFSAFALHQIRGLRTLQTETIDLNEHDSLLLLRVQNDLNRIGLKLRDMMQPQHGTSLVQYRQQFADIRGDLERALNVDSKLRPLTNPKDKHKRLKLLLSDFWRTSDQAFNEAAAGQQRAAKLLIAGELSAKQSQLTSHVSHLLERNTEGEELADQTIAGIYNRTEWNTYAFLAAVILTIAATTLYLIYSNRRIFEKLAFLSRQHRVLAANLISIQEQVLRSVSRELHDEFGQILTAVNAMLGRAERKGVPPDSPLRTELSEVREITHNTLEKMRSLSQMLHPAVLDDYGLAKGIEWYVGVFERQTGIQTTAITEGPVARITGQAAIHCFRIVQEALNNAAKHAHTSAARVEMIFTAETLTIHVKDYGRGIVQSKRSNPGLGLIAMRERAELVNGTLNIYGAPNVGTTVSLKMPLRQEEYATDPIVPVEIKESFGEVFSHKS